MAHALPEWIGRTSTLPNGVDTDVFAAGGNLSTEASAKTILFVGRISPEKGLHVLMDAFQEIVKRFSDANLQIVGPDAPTPEEFLVRISGDPLVRELRRFYGAESYGDALRKRVPPDLARRVNFMGAVSHSGLPDVYREAAVLVNPSLSESFGMSVIEAMACGCPVVVANTGGMKDIVQDEVNGLIVTPDDPQALAASVCRLLAEPALASRLATVARRKTTESYDWRKVAARTLELHRQLVNGGQ